MNIRSDTLARLAADRALGGLDADTAELLDAYVEDHPEAASVAVRDAELVSLATRAMASADDQWPRQRPLAVLKLPRRQPSAWRGRLLSAAGLAACLLVGLLLGRLGTAPRQRVSSVAQDSQPVVRYIATDSRPERAAGAEFWTLTQWQRPGRP